MIDKLIATISSNLKLGDYFDDGLFSSDPIFTSLDELDPEFFAAASSLEADQPNRISKDFISKIWSVSPDVADSALKCNSHLNKQTGQNNLSRQFTTNDRMLRYKRINSLFFTDTFYTTKNATSRP